ncbi:MAG: cytochrome-c peroxidase [Bacteroidia bacterium]
MENVNKFGNSDFTDAELSSFSGVLSLKKRLFNYANPVIPGVFGRSDGTLEVQDNTPENNPVTDAGATLGRVLFYDKKLSKNLTISCASCHQQDKGFSDPDQFSVGFDGKTTRRHSMTLINSRWFENGTFFWDERANSLEEQVLMPIEDHIEMGLSLTELVQRLDTIPYYDVLFTKAFGSNEVNPDRISRALAQFTRSIVSLDSRFLKAVVDADLEEVLPDQMRPLPMLTDLENEGLDIFYNLGTCGYCHMGPALVADAMKNNGLDLNYKDKGRGDWSGNKREFGFFKAPSLANIELSAPYMHDGRFQTLEEVIEHYDSGVKSHPNLNFRLTEEDRDGVLGGTPLVLELSQKQKDALLAFMKTFTDDKLSRDEKFSDPFL